ncbi:hypothetical protein ACROYT_G002754 [Oculina patagonica]
MENWIVFDGDIPLDEFLEKNRPSAIKFINMGVFAGDPKQRPSEFEYPLAIPEPQKQTLLEEWGKRIKNPRRITKEYVRHLAEEYSYKSGKWLIYCPSTQIDEIWTTVAKAVVTGTLGSAANVFKTDDSGEEYLICVYTEDFTNKEDVWAVERSIRKLGVKFTLRYKPNIYTTLGIYTGNEWQLRPTIYRS